MRPTEILRRAIKRIVSAAACLLLIFSLTITAFAAAPKVSFTADSLPEVGGTLTVDKAALLENSRMTSEMYNALLEGHVIYTWYKNGMVTQAGTGGDSDSYKLLLSDLGCTIRVEISFFADDSFQDSKQCGIAVSGDITVTGAAPEIITESLAEGAVGKPYYVRLECSDPDAVFSEIMGSQLTEFGLYLTQHGEIEGTPTKAGNCHINVLAVSEGGGENSVSFDLTVKDAEAEVPKEPTPPAEEPAPPTEEPTPPTEEPTPPESDSADVTETARDTAEDAPFDGQGGEQSSPWIYVVVAVGGIGVGIGIALIFTKKRT